MLAAPDFHPIHPSLMNPDGEGSPIQNTRTRVEVQEEDVLNLIPDKLELTVRGGDITYIGLHSIRQLNQWIEHC